MASIKRNKAGKWGAQIARNGVRKSGTFETKAGATRWASQVEGEILGGKRGAIDKTFADLLIRYRDEVVPAKAHPHKEEYRINWLVTEDIAKLSIQELDASHVSAWRDKRLKKCAPSTVIREMATMSAAFTVAVKEWKWLDHNHFKDVKWPKAPEGRERRITDDEIERILFSAGYDYEEKPKSVSARTAAAFLFAIETGMRDGELAGLTMDRVNLDKKFAHLRAGDTKGRVKRYVGLSPEAIRIIRQMDVTEGLVFGLTAVQVSATFRRIKSQCMIKDLTFHDTRHEAITRLSKKLDVLELARHVGHKNLNQLLTYYNKSASDIADKL